MLNNIIFITLFLLFLSSFAYAEDVTLIMPIEDAKKIVVNLEKTDNYSKQITVLEQTNGELNTQIGTLNQQVQLKQDKVDLCSKEMENVKKIGETKLKVCEDSKDTFMDKIWFGLGTGGIGALIAIIAIAIL